MANQITQKLGFDASSAIAQLTTLTTKLNEANASLEEMNRLTGGNKVGQDIGPTEKDIKRVGGFTLTWRTMLRAVATRVVTGWIGQLLNQFPEAIKSATEFRLRLAEVQSIGHSLGMTTDDLSVRVRELSSQIGKSASDVAEGLYQTLSNQVVKAADAFTLLEQAEKLAAVTHSETKDAVNAISSVMNSYNKSIVEVTSVSDTLFKTVEQGRLRLADIANILGRVLPLTSKMGVSFEEASAAIATMTRSGVKADQAITQLRAVMQKLVKPTDELREIFRSWGVQDGAAAIKTFGGLTNVLKKLSEETNGNTQEMADLFRRVRAIVGVLGIMTEEGQKMEQIMGEMADATDIAKKAWDDYAKTDAQKLTQDFQAMKNELIGIGEVALPVLAGVTDWVKRVSGYAASGLRIVSSWYDRSIVFAFRMQKTQELVDERIEQSREEEAKSLAERTKNWNEFSQSVYKTYAEMNKRENAAANVRDDIVERANAVYKRSSDDIVNYYQGNADALKKFVDDAAKDAKEAASDVAEIQQRIDDANFKLKLDKTKSNSAKIVQVEREAAKRAQQTAQAFGALDGGEAAKEEALAAVEQERSIVKQLVSLRKKEGHALSIQKAERQMVGLLEKEKSILQTTSALRKEKVPEARDQLLDYQKQVDTVREILLKLREVETGGDLESNNAAIRKNAETRKNSLRESLSEAYAELRKGDEFIQSLGLEVAHPLITDMLQNAFDSAHINWKSEVDRGREEFKKFTAETEEIFATNAAKRSAAEELIGPQGDRQTGDFYLEATEKARDVEKELAELLNDQKESRIRLEEIQASRLKGLQTEAVFQRGLTEAEAKNLSLAQRIGVALGSRTMLGTVDQTKAAELRAKYAKENADAAWEEEEAVGSLQRAFIRMTKVQGEGTKLTESQIMYLAKSVDKARARGMLEEEFTNASVRVLKGFQATNAELEKIEKTQEAINLLGTKGDAAKELIRLTIEEGKALKQQEETIRRNQEARGKEAREAGKTEAAVKKVTKSTKDAETAQSRVTEKTTKAKDQAGQLQVNMFYVQDIAKKTGENVEEIRRKLKEATDQGIKLKDALSDSGSGGAAQFFGGPMRYFAQGGVRGADNIPTMLTRGETVINRRNSQRFFSQLNAMNQGSQPVYREQGGPVTNVGDINVSVNGGDTSQQTVRDIGNQLRREIKRGTLKLS